MLGEGLNGLTQVQSTLYTRHASRAADKLARECWALYGHAVQPIIENQPMYELPAAPYRFDTCSVNDGYGNIYPISAITTQEANAKFPNWLSSGQWPGIPQCYVEEGIKRFYLLPIPNYSIQDGITITGYWGVPFGLWDMSTDSPLGTNFDEAVMLGTCYYRCREMKAIDPQKYGPLEQQYKRDFQDAIEQNYGEAVESTEARRGGVVPARQQWYGWWAFGFWG